MPLNLARRLFGLHRTHQSNHQLGLLLAAVAGAINAGGFLAVQQYTSHITGMVSAMADNTALGHWSLVLDGAVAVLFFLLGATTCSVLVVHAKRRHLTSTYALPLLLEAALIVVFGLLGAKMQTIEALFVPTTVLLLCFIMGLQNALITKVSNAVIRTTHMTGIVTDLGIELGKWVAGREHPLDTGVQAPSHASAERMRVLAALFACFLGGGVVGAFGFKWVGFGFTLPIAVVLAAFAVVPFLDDLRARGH